MSSIIKVDTVQDQDGNNIINENANTITIGASGDTITIPSGATLANSGIITGFESTGIDDNATSTSITIDSSENVGIGTTTVDSLLHLQKSDTTAYSATATDSQVGVSPTIYLENPANSNISVGGQIVFGMRSTEAQARIGATGGSSPQLTFGTADAERMRIDEAGNVLVGTTSTDSETAGIRLKASGDATFTKDSSQVVTVNRLTNDGELIRFKQASTTEGNISVSGGTVSYNGFTGTHWSRFQDNSTPTILKGTVLETLDEMCDWYNLEFDVTDENENTHTEKVPHVLLDSQSDGDVITYNHNGTDVQATIVKEADVKHMMSKVSDTVDAKNVYGLFVAYDLDGEGYNDFFVASVGSYVVRIKANETIAKGDLLQSNGDGTAKVQSDDNIKSSSFAKVLSTTVIETYEDGSYLVPCSLMC